MSKASSQQQSDSPVRCAGIALDQLALALDLTSSETRDRPESVHEIRRVSKRLRSLWWLIRPSVGGKLPRKADRALRKTSRMLAARRDVHVMAKTMRSMVRNGHTKAEKEAIAKVAEALKPDAGSEDETKGAPLIWSDISEALRRETERWRTIGPELDRSDWIEGVQLTYRKGQRWAVRAFASDTPKAFHKWRKWVKYLSLQLAALSLSGVEVGENRLRRTARLAERLGNYHDLYNVRLQVGLRLETVLDYRTLKLFYQVYDRMEVQSKRTFRKDCGGIYAEKPRAFVARGGA